MSDTEAERLLEQLDGVGVGELVDATKNHLSDARGLWFSLLVNHGQFLATTIPAGKKPTGLPDNLGNWMVIAAEASVGAGPQLDQRKAFPVSPCLTCEDESRDGER